jgi:hypothetical protein
MHSCSVAIYERSSETASPHRRDTRTADFPEFCGAFFGAETGFLASEHLFGGALWRRRVRTGRARCAGW